MFGDYLARWQLTPDGDPIITRNSRLLPVRQEGVPAMLKVASDAEERRGGLLMAWWDGDGAARVLAQEGDTILLERATGPASLAELVGKGHDDEASRIICAAAARLHVPRRRPPPDLIPLPQRFSELEPAAAKHGGILALSASTARALLATPREVAVLHGDIHHGNILDFGERGWLAIDPKGLVGERGFDYANIFCNPDHVTATTSARFARRLDVVRATAGLEQRRLLQWILAWAGLSAAWALDDGLPPDTALAVAEIAADALGR
ncbi:MAG: aminoglycoside phosphotransferase family protein [Kiloniellales bacterium]